MDPVTGDGTGSPAAGWPVRGDAQRSTGSPGGPNGVGHALGLAPRRWDGVDGALPYRGLITVVAAWALLAWARFGSQAIEGPRAVLRFLLVGVYAWLLQAFVVWVTGLAAERTGRAGPRPDPTRALQFTGLAHQPVVILGLAVQLGAVVPLPILFTALAVVALLGWLPGQLVTAMASAFGRLDRWSLAAAVLAYGAWAVLAGRYLLDRVGHLL